MSDKKQHIVVNIDSVHINNQALFVIEFTDDNILPSDVFMISDFDEIEEITNVDFSKFPLLERKNTFDDAFDFHLDNVKQLESLYCNNTEIPRVDIPLDEVVMFLNKKHGSQHTCEDFENNFYIEYVKDNFHIDFVNENFLKTQAKKVGFFGQMRLEEYLKERKETKGF